MNTAHFLFPFVWWGARVLYWTFFVLAAGLILFAFLSEVFERMGLEKEARLASLVVLFWFAAIRTGAKQVVRVVFCVFWTPLCVHGE